MTSRKRSRDSAGDDAAEARKGKESPHPGESPPQAAQGTSRFPVVGIGASAGGLEALETFLRVMPADAGIAYVLVIHLDPTHHSILPELLQRQTQMPVREAEDGMTVEPDHVYVIPPNRELAIRHGALQLRDLSQPRGSRLPIDAFLRTLALDQNSMAVGVILSGTGSDGSLGVKAIKCEAGMVMVQDPASAGFDGMPASAIATGFVDFVLPPERMPEQIIRYTRRAAGAGAPGGPDMGGIPARDLQKIFTILRARTDHDFTMYKRSTICRRIERRMTVHQINTVSDYVRFLQESDHEPAILFKELLISVTSFFRDPEAYKVLQDVILPEMLASKPDNYVVRVWVPGCATGEEAYSIAIVLHEIVNRLGRGMRIHVFGTDLDADAIAVARAGLYPAGVAADVGAQRTRRYFSKESDGQLRVKKLIREMVVFAPQNVIKDPPFTKLDLLCCRNLLIYLDAELQKRLLPIFHYSLKPDGILFLGTSETIGQAGDLFATADKKWKIYHRTTTVGATQTMLDLPTRLQTSAVVTAGTPQAGPPNGEEVTLRLAEAILRNSPTPPCVVVDGSGKVIYIHGRTGRYLELAEGRSNLDIIAMARPGLKAELATALREVAARKREIVRRELCVRTEGGDLHLALTVRPVLDEAPVRGLMLVVFEETEGTGKKEKPVRERTGKKRANRDIDEVQRELDYVRESLQTTIEELESANEELKSTNEELQSTNEELQSSNEELETSKEELQSLNEESSTVNAELQARIDDLSATNDDMKNLLDSTEIATIFLDTELSVRRFTPRATDVIPLTATDVGRPLEHLATSLVGVDLVAYSRRVLDDLAPRELEVTSRDQHRYIVRMRPYRTAANVIDGVVITLEDCTERKQVQESLKAREEQIRIVTDNVPALIAYIDTEQRYCLVNKGYETWFGRPRSEVLGMHMADVLGPEIYEASRAHMEKALAGHQVNFSFEAPRAGADTRLCEASYVPQLDDNGAVMGVFALINDVSERRRNGRK